MNFFYDSYAFIEYLNGNVQYKPYFEQHTGITTIFNVVEVYYSILRDQGKYAAAEFLPIILSLVVNVDGEVVQKAMEFKLLHKKKDISYTDSIGHQIATERHILFLTGDIQFKNMPQVEFVK